MKGQEPPVVCVVGKKNAGKTEVTVALAAEMNRRGFRVMTVKHGHGFQVDQPGRDSWRHRHEGGALRTVLAGPRDFAVLGAWPEAEMPLPELVSRFLFDADLVVAEGFKRSPQPKVEVIRAEIDPDPLFDVTDPASTNTIAVLTDRTDFHPPVPVIALHKADWGVRLADLLQDLFSLERSSGSKRSSR